MEEKLNSMSLVDKTREINIQNSEFTKPEPESDTTSEDAKTRLREHKKRLRARQQNRKQNTLDHIIDKIPMDLESVPNLYLPVPRLNHVLEQSTSTTESVAVDNLTSQENEKCVSFWKHVPANCSPDNTRLTSDIGGEEIVKRERKRQEKYAKKLSRKLEDKDITSEEMKELLEKHGRQEEEKSQKSFSLMSADRGIRKCWQVENLASLLELFFIQKNRKLDCVVDFGSGSGNLCLALAAFYRDVKFIFVDMKLESLNILKDRAAACGLTNIEVYQHKFSYDNLGALELPKFDLGIGLHCCGSFTDMVMEICRINKSDCIVCPCCNGKMGNDVKDSASAHLDENDKNYIETTPSDDNKPSFLSYPRSKWLTKCISEYEYLLYVSRAADDQNNYLAKCLIEYDRSQWAGENGFSSVHLFKMNPTSATPKHHILYLEC